ncbi:STN domain-containing protein [Sphingosinicellaceae bacterium]|nr:STN domain-containing protein [Sphingosinicellaceae bacterium]
MAVHVSTNDRGWGVVAAGAVLLASQIAPGVSPVAAQASAPIVEYSFDIAAQPLNLALANFARKARVSIAYESELAVRRRSVAIRGRYTVQIALRALLAGTGLDARFTGPASAIVYPGGSAPPPTTLPGRLPSLRLDLAEVRAPLTIGTPVRHAALDYARRAQGEIRTMLNTDPAFSRRSVQLRIAIGIDPAGRIEHVDVIRKSADTAPVDDLPEALTGRQLSTPPPPELEQPMRFDVTTGSLGSFG